MAPRKTSAAEDQRRFGVSMTAAEEAQLRGEGGNAGPADASPTEIAARGADRGEMPRQDIGAAVPKPADAGVDTAAAAERPVDKSGMVPIAALHEERERRKDLQRQIEALSHRTDERLRMIFEKLSGPMHAQDTGQGQTQAANARREIPDPEKDALGAIRMTAEEVRVLSDFKRRLEGQVQASQVAQQVLGATSRLEQEFQKTAADYPAAVDFMKRSRAGELMAMGVDPFRAQQMVAAEGVQLAHLALQQGRNPAEVIYTLARSRGYAPPRPAGDQRQTGAEHLQRISRGQDAGTSLGAASGAAPGKTGIEALLAMSDGDFAAALDKMTPAQLRQHFGN